jgi:hypothetical protein
MKLREFKKGKWKNSNPMIIQESSCLPQGRYLQTPVAVFLNETEGGVAG